MEVRHPSISPFIRANVIHRPSAFARTVDTYSEPLEARGWSEDDLLVRFDEDDSLVARDIYETGWERREETDLLAREPNDYLYARSAYLNSFTPLCELIIY